MENFLFHAHSGLRWIVVGITLVAVVALIVGLAQARPYGRQVSLAMRAFSILVGLQWVLGVVLFLVLGGFDIRHRWEHAFAMTVALVTAHVHYMIKKRPERVRYIGGLASVIVTLVLVYIGVIALPQGWGLG